MVFFIHKLRCFYLPRLVSRAQSLFEEPMSEVKKRNEGLYDQNGQHKLEEPNAVTDRTSEVCRLQLPLEEEEEDFRVAVA